MKLRSLLAATAALSLMAAASAASAANILGNIVTATFSQYQTALNPGEVLVTSFEGGPGLGSTTFYQPGWSITGTGLLYDAWDGNGAPPATAVGDNDHDRYDGDHDPTQYLSILGGQDVTITTPGIKEISFYIGSFDGYNHLQFNYFVGLPDSADGSWVSGNVGGINIGGNQNAGANNGRLTLTFDKSVSSIKLWSDTNSFELSDVATLGAVPEPASWALMIMGFGGVGAVLRSRRKLATA